MPKGFKRSGIQGCKIARSFVLESACAVSTSPPRESADADLIARTGPASRPQAKGQQTRATILEAALGLAAHMGLEGLSIGALADTTRMSKSGVFAHFGSREELQISVIREYHARFEEEVFLPALKLPRGLPRLRDMFERWVRRVSVELDSGCIYISGAVEFDDRPGPVRDALVEMVRTWHQALQRAIAQAIESGHLRDDTDSAQILFEVHGLILALHHDARFLRNPGVLDRARAGFSRLMRDYEARPAQAAADEAPRRPRTRTLA
jgi:AcrR family transcriptional regulator